MFRPLRCWRTGSGSAVLLLALLLARRQGSALLASFRNGRHLLFYLLTTLLISTNWLLYIWAVQTGRILEASPGITSIHWSTSYWACCSCAR